MDDLISREAALDCFHDWVDRYGDVHAADEDVTYQKIEALPSAQPEPLANCSEFPNNSDTISRQAAIAHAVPLNLFGREVMMVSVSELENLPSAQPERTCVNCGRTANNGGWYADGRTRCPIEEHYALPKDGYCHLWEKRNVTDDDYPERREE